MNFADIPPGTKDDPNVKLVSEPPATNVDTAPPLESAFPLLDAISVFTRILDRDVTKDDLVIGLPDIEGDIPLEFVPRVLQRLGLVARVSTTHLIKSDRLPVCASLQDGTYCVVIRREKKHFILADIDIPGGERKVEIKRFKELFSGTVIEAFAEIEDLERRYVGKSFRGHWFWSKFYSQKKLIFEIVLGSLFANLLAVAVSLFALQVYDRVIPNQSVTTLWVLVLGAGLAILMEAFLRISRSYLMDVAGKKIEIDISTFLFQKLAGMRLSTRPASPGSLVYMMREFGSVREFFTATSVGSVADIPFVGIFLLLIYAIAGNVVWVIISAAVVIVLPSLLAQGKMSRLSEEMLGGTSAAGKLLTEIAYAHETVKSVRGEGFFQRKWEEINTLTATKTTAQRALAAGLTYWSASIQQIAYISAVVAGVYLVFTGEFTVGTIIAVSILTSRTLAPITQLSGALARWQQIKAALKGLEEIASSDQDRPIDRSFARRAVLTGNISIKDLSFGYTDEDAPNLKVDNLQISKGEKIAILGANGSGKSTLLKILSGLFSARAGNISIDNLDLRQIDPEDIRRNIGYLPQEVKLFSGTLRDNLNMGSKRWDEDILFAALDFAGVGGFIRSHARGLDVEIADGGDGLSIGQRQSIGLARLYLQDPRIILLDEPTASLDQNLETNFIANLEGWLSDRTCVIATHRLPILTIVSRVIVLQNGSPALDGPRDKVLEKLTGNTPNPKK